MDGVVRIGLKRVHKFKPQSELFFVTVTANTALVADTFKFRRIASLIYVAINAVKRQMLVMRFDFVFCPELICNDYVRGVGVVRRRRAEQSRDDTAQN